MPQPLPVGTRLEVRFHLEDDQPDIPITCSATVARVEPDVGMGINFDGLSPEQTARIRFYVGALFFGQDPADHS